MARAELGTKRTCGSCGSRFYDLSRDPIICPKCGTEFVVAAASNKVRPEKAAKKPEDPQSKEVEEDAEEDELEGAELVTLEDADDEGGDTGAVKTNSLDGDDDDDDDEDSLDVDIDIEVEIDDDDDDDTFLEDEDDDDNVEGIVVGGNADDDDT